MITIKELAKISGVVDTTLHKVVKQLREMLRDEKKRQHYSLKK